VRVQGRLWGSVGKSFAVVDSTHLLAADHSDDIAETTALPLESPAKALAKIAA
jgi:hypothetical protein